MPIYLSSEESERAPVAGTVQPKQFVLGARGDEQDTELVGTGVIDAIGRAFHALMLRKAERLHGADSSTVPAAKQQEVSREGSGEGRTMAGSGPPRYCFACDQFMSARVCKACGMPTERAR